MAKWGIQTFDATYDIIDFDKTIEITDLYDADGTNDAAVNAQLAEADLETGIWEVLAFWWSGDAVTVSNVTEYPSYRVNYFSEAGSDALMDYYKTEVFRLGQPGFEDMADLLRENGGCIFADSYGADANWTMELPDKFLELTGEEITKYLPAMFYANGDPATGRPNPNKTAFGYAFADGSEEAFKNDYMDAMTDLLIENQLQPLTEASNELGLMYRDQVVYATSRLDMIEAAAYVDIPDGESLNMVDSIDYYNAMTTASRLLGKEITSSEHAATYGPTVGNYALPIKMVIDQANRAYAGGMNQLILHYATYEELDYPGYQVAMWPGFSAMGSHFSDSWRQNSPKWEHVDIMTDYMSRMGYVMRQGTVQRDVAVYKQSYWWPRHQSTIWGDTALRNAGYTYDFMSSGLIELDEASVTNGILAADTAAYKAFIYDTTTSVDFQDVDRQLITLATIEKLAEYVTGGLPIVFIGSYPTGLQGLTTAAEQTRFETALNTIKSSDKVMLAPTQADAASALKALGIRPAAENLTSTDLTSYRNVTDEGITSYFLYNCSNNYVEGIDSSFYNSLDNYDRSRTDGGTVTTRVALTGTGTPYMLDPYTGQASKIAEYSYSSDGRVIVEVNLEVNDATVIALMPEENDLPFGTCAEDNLLYDESHNLILRATGTEARSVFLNDGSVETYNAELPGQVENLTWDLVIKSYTNANDITSVGAAATEMKYTDISGITLDELVSWKELGVVEATLTEEDGSQRTESIDLATVSGIGTYTTALVLGSDWSTEQGYYIDIENSYDTVKIFVNGEEIPTVNQMSLRADIGDYLVSGENEIVIQTNTTLSNALVALRSDWYNTARVNDYGITGSVDFIPYTEIVVREFEIPAAEPTTAPTTDESTSDTTTETTTDGEDVPQTGDNLPYAALVLVIVAVLAAGGIVLLRKSHKNENTQQDE